MEIRECLKEMYEEEMDKVFAVSANYLMTIPKKGYEKEHEKHTDRATVLKCLITQADRLGD